MFVSLSITSNLSRTKATTLLWLMTQKPREPWRTPRMPRTSAIKVVHQSNPDWELAQGHHHQVRQRMVLLTLTIYCFGDRTLVCKRFEPHIWTVSWLVTPPLDAKVLGHYLQCHGLINVALWLLITLFPKSLPPKLNVDYTLCQHGPFVAVQLWKGRNPQVKHLAEILHDLARFGQELTKVLVRSWLILQDLDNIMADLTSQFVAINFEKGGRGSFS